MPNEKQHTWPFEQLAELVHGIVAPVHAPMAVHVAAAPPEPPPAAPPPPPRVAQHTCVALSHVALPHAVVPVVEPPLDEDALVVPDEDPLPDDAPISPLSLEPRCSALWPPPLDPAAVSSTSRALRSPQPRASTTATERSFFA